MSCKLFMVSLGCDKNLVDAERMLGILAARGYEITDDETEAEAAVVNTCCFIEDAKKESIDKIFELARLKEGGKLKVLVAAGCMAQRYRGEIMSEIPELDAIVGTTGIDGIAKVIDQALQGQSSESVRDPSTDPACPADGRIVTTGGHYAYLKIAEGCDKNCTYCAIPSFRGHYRSYPMEALTAEAEKLAAGGVRELILVAQETTLYGTDLYGRKALPELLKKLAAIPELRWIRLLYCYPEEIDDALIAAMASEPKVCRYLDLPIQHASDAVLRRMNRRTTGADIRRLVAKLRAAMPDIVLRTTLISGFPGETEEDHRILLDFIREVKFDHLGVFLYSREEGTPAAAMKGQVPKKISRLRQSELMTVQQKISLEANRARIGREMTVFVEGSLPEEQVYVARSAGDAPQVDGFVFFRSDRTHMSGDFVPVRITDASEYDLQAEELQQQE